jgi:regulatory protein
LGADRSAPSNLPPSPSSETFPEALREAALRLLSLRNRSVQELRGRLLDKAFDPGKVDACIRWLQERRFLDDGAFARAFVRDRIRFSPRSPFLIQRELKDRGIAAGLAREAVESAMEEEDLTPAVLATRVAEAWVRKQPPARRRALLEPRFDEGRERARRSLYGFLARRGFVGDEAREGLEAGERAARAVLQFPKTPRGP